MGISNCSMIVRNHSMYIYSKSCPPKGFNIYAYLRDDGTPYYIGKGKGVRAWKQHAIKGKGAHTPKDGNRIIICETNLTEVGAFALERRYIRWYGRKDLSTGILVNLTNGGEGTSNVVRTMSESAKQKIGNANRGRIQTEETKQKRSRSLKGRKPSEESNVKRREKAVGRVLGPQSEERRAKTSQLLKEWWAKRKSELVGPVAE